MVFLVAESRVQHPFVRLKLFANSAYSALVGVSGVLFFCLMAFQILLPLYLIQLRGLSAPMAGLAIGVLPITLALFSPFAGGFADRWGHRITIRTGMLIICLTTATMLLWPEDAPLWVMTGTLGVIGVGMGFTQSPAVAAVTLFVRNEELGVAMGIFNMLRFVSATLGASISGFLIGSWHRQGELSMHPFRVAFVLISVLAAMGVLLHVFIPPLKPDVKT
jgi:MFS family permease